MTSKAIMKVRAFNRKLSATSYADLIGPFIAKNLETVPVSVKLIVAKTANPIGTRTLTLSGSGTIIFSYGKLTLCP